MKTEENRIVVKAQEGNMTPVLQEILQKTPANTVISFEKAEYHFYREGCLLGDFYPSNNAGGKKEVVFSLLDKKNLILEGNGAAFVFHGRLFPFILQGCEKVTLRNFSVDFAFPRIYRADVLEAGQEYLELQIDEEKYPYEIVDGELIYCLEEGKFKPVDTYLFNVDAKPGRVYGERPVFYHMVHLVTGEKERTFADDKLETTAVRAGKNRVCFRYKEGSNKMFYEKGDRLALHFEPDRKNDTFFLEDCRNITFDGVKIYRGCGMGIVAQLCENMRLTGLHIGCRKEREDVVSTTADAIMLIDCTGKVTLDHSYIAQSLDDGVNVHGTYLPIERAGGHILAGRLGHREQEGFNPLKAGDRIAVADGQTLEMLAELTVAETILGADRKRIETRVCEPVPETVKAGDLIYNLDRMPELEFIENEFYQVPSLLFGSAKRSYFARNRVNTRLEALRLGDLGGDWYEASRKKELIVEENVFDHCAEWYSVSPVINAFESLQQKSPKRDIHQNLVFRKNRFLGVNQKLFSLECCTDVKIEGNTYVNTGECVPEDETVPVRLAHCAKVECSDNSFCF